MSSKTAIVAASLLLAVVYGVIFQSTYRQPIDAEGGVILFLLAFLTVLAGLGLLRLARAYRPKAERRQFTIAPGPGIAPGGHFPRMIMPSTSSLVMSSTRPVPTT